MKMKIPISLLTMFCSFGLMAQATLNVEGFARFEETVSIGPKTGDAELEINDTNNNNSVLTKFKTDTQEFITGMNVSSGNFYGTTTDDKVSFITNDVVRMILTPEGFLGIGTPGPSERLHVREDGDIGTKTTVMVLESAISKRPTLKFDEGSNLGMSIEYNGTGNGDNNKMNILTTAGTGAMTLTNGGNVGIREFNPDEALDIDGSAVIEADGSINELRFYDGNTVEAKMAYDGVDLSLESSGFAGNVEVIGDLNTDIKGLGDIILDGGSSVSFFTNVSTKGFVSSAGLFGINQTQPDGMFHVRAFGSTGAALRMENDQNTNHWSWRAKDDQLQLQFNGTLRGFYSGSTGAYTVVSDKRLKENITVLEDGVLEDFHKLKASEYYFKSSKNKEEKSIGFIAQEVLEVFPHVVTKPESEDGYYGIQYSNFSVLAIKALQEQQKEIDGLAKEIEAKKAMKEKIASYRVLAEKLQGEISALEMAEVKE